MSADSFVDAEGRVVFQSLSRGERRPVDIRGVQLLGQETDGRVFEPITEVSFEAAGYETIPQWFEAGGDEPLTNLARWRGGDAGFYGRRMTRRAIVPAEEFN